MVVFVLYWRNCLNLDTLIEYVSKDKEKALLINYGYQINMNKGVSVWKISGHLFVYRQ